MIVTGGFDHVSLGIFLQELFHEDHGFRQTNAVVLSPQPPDGRVRNLLNETTNVRRSKYIQGSPMDGQVGGVLDWLVAWYHLHLLPAHHML